MPKIDTRCLECSHEFPTETLVLAEEGWCCPKCGSPRVERILVDNIVNINVKYEEGYGHD